MSPTAKLLQALRDAGCGPKLIGGRWQSKCPAHTDEQTSLSLTERSDECVLVECHAGCSTPAILDFLNLRDSDLIPGDSDREPENTIPQASVKESGETESRDLELLPASRITPRPTRWLWRDRLPLGGACLFAGQEGLGKTTIAVEIAARASRGQLEGDLYGEPCSIVYATAEDSWARTLRPRFEAANADLERVHFILIDGLEGGLEVPGDLESLEKEMRKVGARLLVLDPLTAHLHGSLDTHRDASVRKALAPLAAIMDRLEASALGIMHWSKAPTSVVLDRVNGSRGFTAAARAVLAVGEDPEDKSHRVLVLAKSNLGRLDVPALRYEVEGRTITTPDAEEIATSGIVWLGEAPGVTSLDLFSTPADDDERSERSEVAEVVRQALADGPKPRTEVVLAVKAAGLTVSDKTVQRACRSLGVDSKPGGYGAPWVLTLPNLDSVASVNMTQKPVQTVQTVADLDSCSPQCGHEVQSGHMDGDSIELPRLSEPPTWVLSPSTHSEWFGPDGSCLRCGQPPVRRGTLGWFACPHQITAGMVPNA